MHRITTKAMVENKKNRIHQIYLFLCLIVVFACDKNPIPKDDITIPAKTSATILIGNEGQFMHGDASVTLIDITNNQQVSDIFKTANNRPIGDIVQSIALHNDKYFVVVNNSQKIEVLNRSNYQSLYSITGLVSPRYIAFVNDHKAYVSEFFSNFLVVVNPSTGQIIKKIDCGSWQDEIKIIQNKLCVTANKTGNVLIIDPTNDSITHTVYVGKHPTSLDGDAKENIWVGSTGEGTDKAVLNCISGTSFQVIKTISLNSTNLRKIKSDNSGTKIYVLADDLLSINTTDSIPSANLFVAGLGLNHTYYGLGVDPKSGDIYISDAKNFQEQSIIYHYNTLGNLTGQFSAGINSSSFCFYYE